MKQSIDSKGLPANVFAYEEHINGNGSLLTEMAVTRAELGVLAAHYQGQVDDYKRDGERFPEDGISSREWARAAYAARRLKRIEEELAKEPIYEGLEASRPDCECIEPEICPVCSPGDFNSDGTVQP
jgi:hypothetical protein